MDARPAALSLTLPQMYEIAGKLAKSGIYQGINAEALFARIMAGVALGLDPVTSCSNLAFSNGKMTVTAAVQGALLANSTIYDMCVREIMDERCVLEITRYGKKTGVSSYSVEEAKRAGLLSKDAWRKYPSDMLFARALTRGIRRFCPNLLVGNAALTREEVGDDVHEPVVMPKPAAAADQTSSAPPATTANGNGRITKQQLDDLRTMRELLQIPMPAWKQIVEKRGVSSAKELTAEAAKELIRVLRTRMDVQSMEEGLAEQNGDAIIIDLPANKKKEDSGVSPESKS
jgi:hypothetical protein